MAKDHHVKIVQDQKVNKAKDNVVLDQIVVQDQIDHQDVNKKVALKTPKAWLWMTLTTQTQVSFIQILFASIKCKIFIHINKFFVSEGGEGFRRTGGTGGFRGPRVGGGGGGQGGERRPGGYRGAGGPGAGAGGFRQRRSNDPDHPREFDRHSGSEKT